jgi:protein-S-isoprenylcysteine O-methyltransferase Ste14
MASGKDDLRRVVFTYRSYTPIPFLIVMVVFARPTLASLITGFCIVLAGEAIRLWGVSIAGSETRTTGDVGGTYLITNGPFAYVRNPLYVGNMLLYVGVGVMSLALFPWLTIVAAVWFYGQYYLIVTREEEYLERQFGDQYREYKAHVGRFFPRLRKFVGHHPSPKSFNVREGLASERRTLQAIGLVVAVLVVLYVAKT